MTGPPRDGRTRKLDDGGAFDGDMPVDDISDVESEREDLAPILVVEQAASEPTQARSISRSVSMLWVRASRPRILSLRRAHKYLSLYRICLSG